MYGETDALQGVDAQIAFQIQGELVRCNLQMHGLGSDLQQLLGDFARMAGG